MRTLVFGISIICYAAAGFVTAMALGSRPAGSSEDLLVLVTPPAVPAERRDFPGTAEGMEQAGSRRGEELERTIVGIRREMLAREEAILERVTREQEHERNLAAKLRETVAGLEEKLAAGDTSALDRLAREQEASRSAVKELQETITGLRREIARRDSAGPAQQAADEELQETAAEGRGESALVREVVTPAGGIPPRPPEDGGEGRVIAILGGGLFSSNQDVVSGEIRKAVEKVLPAIVAHPDHRIVVEGHADSVPIGEKLAGKVIDNRALSLLRAEKIAHLLLEEGVLQERLTVYGLGDSRPLAPNTTPEGRAENRRVEIRLVPPPGAP